MKSLTIIIAVSMLVSPVSGAPTHEKRGAVAIPIGQTIAHVGLVEDSICGSGEWFLYNNYCYLVSDAIKARNEAQQFCSDRTAELVKITSQEENDFVLALVRQKTPSIQQVWIGLQYVSSAFYWSDNSVPTYTNWAPNEPNGNANEPCGHMWTRRDDHLPARAPGYWNDIPCNKQADFPNGIVCKKLPLHRTSYAKRRELADRLL